MTRNARLWAGATLIIVLALNYLVFTVPLIRRGASIERRSRAAMLAQAKKATIFTDSEESYMLDLFRREKADIDRKLMLINLLAASVGILIASWTVFGMLFGRKDNR